MYVITGATGNTGKQIALALLEAGKKVRIISRDATKAKELTDKGAELFKGDTTDAELLKRAFDGAMAVYAMLPNDMKTKDHVAGQIRNAKAIGEALAHCKVPYVVSLSSLGAHLKSGSGIVNGLYTMEKLFNSIDGLNTLHLRPTYFMENTLGMVPLVKQAGIMGSPIKGDVSFPVISIKDIIERATKRLLALDFEGNNVQDLLGTRDTTYAEIAKTYGAAIGKPDLKYVEFSPEDFRKSMIEEAGVSESIADNLNELFVCLNTGKMMELAERDSESTTSTTIEEFSQTFAQVYNS